jgi:hypothetical protein
MIANLKGVSTASDLDSLRKNILEKYRRKKRRAASVEWKELEKTEQEAKKIEEELEVVKKKLAELPTGATESQNDSHHGTRTRAQGKTQERKELEKVVERLEKFRDDIAPRVQRKRKAIESYINMQEVKKPKVRRQAARSRKEVIQQESLPPKRMTSSSRIEYSKPSKLWTEDAWVKVGCLHVLAVIIKQARAVRVIEVDVNTSFGEEAKETQRRTNAAYFDTLAKYVNDKKNSIDQFTPKDLAAIKPTTKANTMDLLINTSCVKAFVALELVDASEFGCGLRPTYKHIATSLLTWMPQSEMSHTCKVLKIIALVIQQKQLSKLQNFAKDFYNRKMCGIADDMLECLQDVLTE